MLLPFRMKNTIKFNTGNWLALAPIRSIVTWMTVLTLLTTGVYSIEDPAFSGIAYHASPAQIVDPPTDQTSVDGKNVTLKCSVSGDPKPIVRWTRDGQELTGNRYRISRTGDLEIISATFIDAGGYTCHAENRFGSANSLANLVVKQRTRILGSPENIKVISGQTAFFHCSALKDSALNLTIHWLRDEQIIDFEAETRHELLENNSLAIRMTSILDSGVYRCLASTELDEASAEANLVVQDGPNAPEITGTTCNARDANITWRAMGDNQSPILYYTIQYSTSFTPDLWEVAYNDVPAANSSSTAPLSPWANYTFRVIAQNLIGPSRPSSNSEVCSTQPDVPFMNPENVRGRGNRPDNLVISWTPMTEIQHNAPNLRYRIEWKLKKSRGRWNREEIMESSRGNITIPNQPTYKPYVITVRAVNERGESNVRPVEVQGFSGQDKPLQAPANLTLLMVVDYKTVVVSWDPILPETVRGKLEGYKLEYWANEADRGELVTQRDTTQARVENLVPLAKNYLRVLVYNSDYEGPPSKVLEVVMKEGFPGPVELLQAFPLSQTALYLSWRKPLETNGSIKGYEIYYQMANGTEVGLKTQRAPSNVGPERTSAKLWGLESGMRYRVHIHAKTGRGEGPGYFTEQTTYSQAALALIKPQFDWSLHESQNGFATIRIQWKPSFNRRPGSHFYIQYKQSDELFTKATPPELFEDFQDIRGLASNETFVMRLVTVDGNVEQGSEPENVHTFPPGSGISFTKATVTKDGDSGLIKNTVIGISTAAGLVLVVAVMLVVAFWWKYAVAVKVIRNLTKEELDEFYFGKKKSQGDAADEFLLANAPYTENKRICSQDLKIDPIILGEGHFGVVHSGMFQEKRVAIKSSKPSADVEHFKAFLKEIKVMAFIGDHENVVGFYGAVVDKIKERSCQAVMELSPFGDLNGFLRTHSMDSSDARVESVQARISYENTQQQVLSYASLMSFCRQIASGMDFLAQKNVIHGDLAARNVLVFYNGIAKITDFGLSRKLYNCANYTRKNGCPLPWRWMAIESLSFFEFSTKSDVWSFGVTMWEILSLGLVPFSGVHWNTDFMDELRSGFRLAKPQRCTPAVYDWMRRCWENEADDRPTFAECLAFLSISDHFSAKNVHESYYYPIDRNECQIVSG